jgi:hypothetical protein
MSGFFNFGKWVGKKSSKGAKAIDKVAPTTGSSMKKAFMEKYRDKRNKAKITQSQMKVERDIEEGYKSVVDRNKSSQEIFKKSKGE